MPEITNSLLEKFIEGRCTEAEVEAINRWLETPANERIVRALMRKHWDSASDTNAGIDVEALLGRTRERITEFSPVQRKQNSSVWQLGVAASVSLIAMCVIAWLLIPLEMRPTITSTSSVQEEVTSSNGQIVLTVLPDGTKVWLNAQSRLLYPGSFGKTREVFLEGEAYFDVVEDPSRPFLVHADDITIRVLGTAFNIKSYPDDRTISTTLVRGKVVIETVDNRNGKTIELEPNQQAVFNHESNDIELHEVDANRYASWTNGSLVFEDDQVYDVLKTLERWYGVQIRVQEKSNLDCRLTARIDKETLSETMALLHALTGMRYTVNDGEVIIQGKICEP
jgi:transmembrane sensor